MLSKRKKSKKIITFVFFAVLSVLIFLIGSYLFAKQSYPLKYSEYVELYSEQNNIPIELTYAVIRSESSFRPDATSSIGAKGLMQITDETLDWIRFRMGEKEDVSYDILYDPKENIKYGTYLLRLLIDEFNSTDTALCAYHAGWGNVKEWLENTSYSSDGMTVENIPFKDTDSYVKKVIHTMNIYKKLYSL